MDFKTMSVEELRARVQEIGVLLEEKDADAEVENNGSKIKENATDK